MFPGGSQGTKSADTLSTGVVTVGPQMVLHEISIGISTAIAAAYVLANVCHDRSPLLPFNDKLFN